MSNYDILSIGDASLDMFVTPSESETLCEIDSKDCYICFSYGEKIPIKESDFSVGGNAANNAAGVTRLGLRTGLVLTLGDDFVGSLIVQGLEEEKVDLTYVSKQPATMSNYSVVIKYLGERTIFTYHAPRSYEFPVQLPVVPWVYLTSMGESFTPFYKHVIEWLRRNTSIKLAFNPGSRQLRTGLEGIGDALLLTDILFVNRQEAEKLADFPDSTGKEKELIDELRKLGVIMPVVTDGAEGAFTFDGVKYLKVGILPVDAYERTGAGDAFGSGFLAAVIKGKSVDEALLWGTVNSSSVIGYTGAQKGLLHEMDLPDWIARAQSSQVVVQEF